MSYSERIDTVKGEIDALVTYANTTTGGTDATIGDAVRTLVSGYGGGGGGLPIDLNPCKALSFDVAEDTTTIAVDIGSGKWSLICVSAMDASVTYSDSDIAYNWTNASNTSYSAATDAFSQSWTLSTITKTSGYRDYWSNGVQVTLADGLLTLAIIRSNTVWRAGTYIVTLIKNIRGREV